MWWRPSHHPRGSPLRAFPLILALVPALVLPPLEVRGQGGGDREAYLRVMTQHFELPPGEADRLLESSLAPDELPVLLFLEQHGGIAAPALLALRRSGSGWSALARRYGVGGDRFHVEIPEAAVDARTRGIHERYAATPRSGWAALDLSDEEIITLVNLKVLSQRFSVPVERVLEARDAAGSWVGVPARLAAGGAAEP
jgi:hypothetical protein